ncbi:MAG: T9SS type A sorting domain-containing protein [Candidatus Poribacteria bacterium]|nr:T9SS type A sorting domain-containing protein [Candidatus Poribacteria bacterium]
MKKYFRLLVIFLVFSCLTSHIASAQIVNVPDANLAAAVRETLHLAPNAPITKHLTALIPKETVLLPNYPNPFNPETWIPYQLAKPADVTLTIYAMDGQVVRQLVLRHQHAGTYQSKGRAVYWDGRNAFSEPVASGLYFYTLTAGDFTATRRMLIRK